MNDAERSPRHHQRRPQRRHIGPQRRHLRRQIAHLPPQIHRLVAARLHRRHAARLHGRRRYAGALTLALALAACSSNGDDPATDTTAAALAPCVAVGDTTPALDVLNTACLEDGEMVVAATGDQQCADGRTLVWNDLGWGYIGEPWQPPTDDGPRVAPAGERDAC